MGRKKRTEFRYVLTTTTKPKDYDTEHSDDLAWLILADILIL